MVILGWSCEVADKTRTVILPVTVDAEQGLRRPGSWERPWMLSVFPLDL